MQMSDITLLNFKGLNIDKGFYKTARFLNENFQTKEGYQKALSELREASLKKRIALNGLDVNGARVVEMNENGIIIREIAISFKNAISAISRAAKILTEEGNPQIVELKQKFPRREIYF